jgi:hypothetical protein
MTWSMFYQACFLIGVTLSALSFLGGSLHLPQVHFPHLHLFPHLNWSHPASPGIGGAHPAAGRGADMPFLNFSTVTAFLAWFGATGYLLTRHSTLLVVAIMGLAIVVGMLGASIVFWFIVKLLLPHDLALDPADYDRIGVLGRVNSSIREGGTGEIIFSQGGARQTCGARSDAGEALPKGIEVIVTRYEHGIAYVRRWEELTTDGGSRKATCQH